MRILHINNNYITSELHQVMMNHFDNSFEHIVFSPTFDKGRMIIEPNPNVIVAECFNKNDRYFFHFKQRKIIRALITSVEVERIGCIHAYTLFTDGYAAYRLSKKYNKPFVVAIRNTDVNDFFKKLIHLRALGVKIMLEAKAIFFLSPSYMENVLSNYVPTKYKNQIEKKCHIIPNGIDDYWHENIFKKNGVAIQKRINESKEIKCLYVGVIDANKNVEIILKALSILHGRGWKCTLTAVGKVIDKKIYRKLNEYSFFDHINQLSKEELIDIYRSNDLFIMVSHKESFGLVYAEALSQGLPVIYTRGQGFDKQFEEGKVGYSVSDFCAEEIADKIEEIVSDYETITGQCMESAERFDWNIITNLYNEIYVKTLVNK